MRYKYLAIDNNLKKATGFIDEPTKEQAIKALQIQHLNVITIELDKKNKLNFSFQKKILHKDIINLTKQLAIMLSAGISYAKSLEMLIQSENNSKIKNLLICIKINIKQGNSVKKSLEKHKKYFSNFYLSLIDIGENTGKLAVMHTKIYIFLEKQERFKDKIKRALYYPFTIIFVAFIICTILLYKVVPEFADIFLSENASLPTITKLVLNLSSYIKYVFLFLVFLISLFFIIYPKVLKNKAKKLTFDKMILRIPYIGLFIKESLINQLTTSLAVMISSGVPLLKSILICKDLSSNLVYQNSLSAIVLAVKKGIMLSDAIASNFFISSNKIQMIKIGEETSKLDSMLEHIAKLTEEELDKKSNLFISLLEPIIIVVLGIIIAVIILAMYLPLFSLGSVLS